MRWARAQSNKRLKTQTSWRSFDIFVFFILKLNNSCANIYMQCAKLCYRLSSTKTIRTKTTFKYLLLVIVVLLTLLSCKLLQALLPLEKIKNLLCCQGAHTHNHTNTYTLSVCVYVFSIYHVNYYAATVERQENFFLQQVSILVFTLSTEPLAHLFTYFIAFWASLICKCKYLLI